MTKLALGMLLWSIVHLIPALFGGARKKLIARIGENPYKGLFTVLTLLSLYLIVSGWKASPPEIVYLPPAWGRYLTLLLTLVGFVLLLAPYSHNNFKRLLRHPQLTGVLLWGVGHLFANGESRSLLLFGGMAMWALAEILLINRREGAWQKPEPAPLKNDVVRVVAGLIAFAIMMTAHQWLFGFSPLP